MIDLKLALGAYLVLFVLSTAAYVGRVGRPREPITSGEAGCSLVISFGVFLMLLLIWQQL